jgi:proline dehydrogenase
MDIEIDKEKEISKVFKSIARNLNIKEYVDNNPEIYSILLRASKRYITGEYRENAITCAKQFLTNGYFVSLEYIGENITDKNECIIVVNEFIKLIKEMKENKINEGSTISLDLSHIGLSINKDFAFENIYKIASETKDLKINIMISMEESSKHVLIKEIYTKISKDYNHIGITIQAQIKESIKDIELFLKYPGKIRIVKGAYAEDKDKILSRGQELNEQYIKLVEMCINKNHDISIATHDKSLLNELIERKYFEKSNVEYENLLGICPDIIKDLKNKGYKTRIYLTYGKDWYLYLFHRLAEYPKNIYNAIVDCFYTERTNSIISYY